MTSDLYFPPSGNWERREASSLGMNELALERAVQFAKENNFQNSVLERRTDLKNCNHTRRSIMFDLT